MNYSKIDLHNFPPKISAAFTAYHIPQGQFKYPMHIHILNKLLLFLSERKFHKLIVNMPPRHGKSEMISKYFPFCYLGNYPSHRIILSSYGANLAEHFGRSVKYLIDNYGSIFSIKISKKSNSASRFNIEKIQWRHGLHWCLWSNHRQRCRPAYH